MKESENAVLRKQALLEGRKRYWTGVPCKYGHIAECATSNGNCVECRNVNIRNFREKKKALMANLPKVEKKIEVDDDVRYVPEGIKPGARVFLMGREVTR